jgi:hypothetical protein
MTPTDIALAFILMSDPAVASTTQEAVSAPVTAPVTTPAVPDGCAGISGYNPACVTVVPIEWVSHPANRNVAYSGNDYGTGRSGGNERFVTIPAAGVLVHGMTMSSEQTYGRVSFAPSTNISGVSLRMWVSSSPDGAQVSGCSYIGYVEAVFSVSTDGSSACNLSPGGTYYLNQALCKSTPSDTQCRDAGATTPNSGARLVMAVDYY